MKSIDTQQWEYILSYKKWHYGTLEHLQSYSLFILPMYFIFLGSIPLISPKANSSLLFTMFLPSLCIGILLFYFLLNRIRLIRNFTEIQTFRTKKENQVIVEEIINRYSKKRSTDQDDNTIVVITKISGFSWGEQVTFILKDNIILLNSRPVNQPITFWKDRKNINYFTREILALAKTLPPIPPIQQTTNPSAR